MSYKVNNTKSAIHAFLLSIGTTVAEPATILPLLVSHFSSSLVLVGIFASLLRGGAIAVQLFAAFYAQSYERVMKYMHRVFFFRFASWFAVGASIYLVGDDNPTLTLWLIGIFFFTFSFSAGFGAIYFKEIIAKVFDSKERGSAMANRQLFSALGAIISGGVTGWVLANFEAPNNYAFLFMISSLIIVVGLISFGSIEEPAKKNISVREKSFLEFLKNSRKLLSADQRLQLQIKVSLLGYSFLLAMPFVIIKAKETVELTGWMIGGFITVQMIGGMIGNMFLWKRFAPNYAEMLQTAYGFMLTAFIIALFAKGAIAYGLIFFIFGIGMDGLWLPQCRYQSRPRDRPRGQTPRLRRYPVHHRLHRTLLLYSWWIYLGMVWIYSIVSGDFGDAGCGAVLYAEIEETYYCISDDSFCRCVC